MKKILFNTRAYQELADKILAHNTLEKGEIEVRFFADGERYQRIKSNVEDRHVVLLGGTIDDLNTLELYDMASGLVDYGAASISIVLPYFGYSTMERAIKQGEIVTAHTRARLLSAIPNCPRGNKIYLFDLHSEGIPHYFENGKRAIHVYCKPLIMKAARDLGGDNFVLASTDAGRAKWVESLANDLQVNAAFVLKRRTDEDTMVTAINADVSGKNVIIYDDMIRSGGSILNAAKVYHDAGAQSISLITTHGIFTGNAIDKLKNSGLIHHIACTDTLPNLPAADDFIKLYSIDQLINSLFE